jgi:hypothetical protein
MCYTGGIAQAAECLLYKCKALNSNPSPTKKKKTKTKKKNQPNKKPKRISNWNSESKNSTCQIKNSVESLFGRLDQTEDRIAGLEDKAVILEHSHKDKRTHNTSVIPLKSQTYESWT